MLSCFQNPSRNKPRDDGLKMICLLVLPLRPTARSIGQTEAAVQASSGNRVQKK